MVTLVILVGLFLVFCFGYVSISSFLSLLSKNCTKIPVKLRFLLSKKYIEWLSILGGCFTIAICVAVYIRKQYMSIFIILGAILIIWIIYSNKESDHKEKTPTTGTYSTQSSTNTIPSQQTRKAIDLTLMELTKSPIWDWECFRKVLICLANQGEGSYIKARWRPDSVSLDGLKSTFTDLRNISIQSGGKETSRAVFVDTDKACLVISGKTRIGTKQKVKIDLSAQPGREWTQLPVITIHVHPSQASSEGMSEVDYISFLSDKRLIAMMICYQGGIMFTMKTSVTTTKISVDTVKRMISVIRSDILRIWNNYSLPNAIVAFNKAVCMEFGMTLYATSESEGNIAYRVEVTR
jgi:hypothetical protein